MKSPSTSGGDLVAERLARRGVNALFTLCGGHISPILVSARARGIRVIDVRDEATAVFAADAVTRLTGRSGVAVVTAGPGVTNTITAIKNAQIARTPIVVLGGATATVLKGRGALQDIDQMALVAPHVKWATSAATVGQLARRIDEAFVAARAGVPGPIFVECPVDLLYPETPVRDWYNVGDSATSPSSMLGRFQQWYLRRHVNRLFADASADAGRPPEGGGSRMDFERASPSIRDVGRAAALVANSSRPVLLVGSQALETPADAGALAEALSALGIPVFLSGMARGLLGPNHPLQVRHHRKEALREADLVILAGTPIDFRLDYGRQIARRAALLTMNRDPDELSKNRRPTLGIAADPDLVLRALAKPSRAGANGRQTWVNALRARDAQRDQAIASQSQEPAAPVNPLWLCREIDRVLPDDSIVVADGGDFVATASYIIRPRGPLRWLDPGAFGTLGVGAGFAIGAHVARPSAEIWLLYGDGAAGYSLMEVDTFVRHGIPAIAVVGNDARWAQIAREQVPILNDDVGTRLRRTDYHSVAEALGAKGLLLDRPEDAAGVLRHAQDLAAHGTPVVVNAIIGDTGFRKGSMAM